MKKSLILLAAVVATPLVSHAAIMEGTDNDGRITLVYDPSTGNLKINLDGNSLGGLSLTSTASVFTPTDIGTNPIYYQTNATGTTLGFAVLSGSISDGTVLPGVFDKSLAESDLLSELTVSSVTNGPPASTITFSGGTTSAPEPASLALIGLGGLAVLRRRPKAE